MKKLTSDWSRRASALLMVAVCGTATPALAQPVGADAAPLAGTGAGAGGAGGFGGAGVMEPPVSDVRVLNAGAGIPVNGALLIYVASGGSATPIVEVAASATPSTTIGGTMTMFMGTQYWVWMPSAPLVEGSTYQVRVSAPDLGIVGNTDTFEVVPAITIARPMISTAPSASFRSETSNSACCRSLFGGVLSDTSCFPSEQRSSIMLEPGFSSMDPAVLLNQFMFRIGSAGFAAAQGSLGMWPNLYANLFYDQAAEYCFELEAIDIISGTVFTYEDLERCAPHGELPELGISSIEPGAAELDRLVCHAPPEQYKDQWCDINEDPCAEDQMATACGLYGFVCLGEPLPPDPFGGMAGFNGMGGFGMGGVGGVGGAGGAGAIGGAGGVGNGGMGGAAGMSGEGEDDEAPSHGDGGCSASPASGGGSTLGYALGAIGLVLASRRRRSC